MCHCHHGITYWCENVFRIVVLIETKKRNLPEPFYVPKVHRGVVQSTCFFLFFQPPDVWKKWKWKWKKWSPLNVAVMIIEELESHFPSTECLQHGATSPWDNFECNYILSQMNEKATIIYYSYAYFWKHPMYYLALKYDAENGWHYLRLSDKKQTSSNIVHIYVRQWRY